MRAPLALLAGVMAVTAALAGCVGPGSESLQDALAAGLAPILPAVGQPPAKFSPAIVVDADLGGTEPSLVVDHEGRILVAAPTGLTPNSADHRFSGQFWRSEDNGNTFEHLEGLGLAGLYGPSIGGGDSDIAADAQGNLYAIDLWLGNVGLLTSQDHGDTWLRGAPLTFASAGDDRQWIDVNQATGEVYIAANSLSTGLWVIKSTDEGATFPQQALAVAHADRGGCICPPGVLTVDEATGNVYLPYYVNPHGVGLAVSKDGGASFERFLLPESDGGHLPDDNSGELGGSFVAMAHDMAGNLYVAWEQDTEAGHRIVLQTSTDQGASWTSPAYLDPIAQGEQIFPWIVAGEPGRAAVAWYEINEADEWNVRLAVTTLGLDAKPSWGISQLNPEPVLTGAYDRSALGDFFEIALAPDGSIHAVWNAKLADGKGAIVSAHQVGGPVLLTGAPGPAPAPERPTQLVLPAVKPTDPLAMTEAGAEMAAEAAGLPDR
ncbi:MAG TPA: sialidase family protein [Candidatus Thermoplasmatota archaeon]|jgi:hypothetical protein|nr:sialidase family protein [Candidatus Thermoplasmatota archaeon]